LLLAAFGAILIVVYGWRAEVTRQTLVDVQLRLAAPVACATDDRAAARCDAILARRAATLTARPSSTLTPGDVDRDVVVAAFGVAALLTATAGLLRRSRSSIQPSSGAWASGECWTLSVFRVLLVLLGLAIAAHLIRGEAPSLSLLDGSVSSVGDAIITAMALLLS
jgi:hypothetical protein